MKSRYLVLIATILIMTIAIAEIAITPGNNEKPIQKTILDGIWKKAESIESKRMLCWDSAVEMKGYLDSLNLSFT